MPSGEELGAGRRHTTPRRRLAAALEHGGYEPYLEATGTIRLRNCPFDALADRHRPLMCGTNLAMAEGIVEGAGVTELRTDPRPTAWLLLRGVRPDRVKHRSRDLTGLATRSGLRGRVGERESNLGTAPRRAVDRDLAAVGADQVPGDRKAEARSRRAG